MKKTYEKLILSKRHKLSDVAASLWSTRKPVHGAAALVREADFLAEMAFPAGSRVRNHTSM